MLNGLIITTLVSSAFIILVLVLSPLFERYFSNKVKSGIWIILAVRMLIPYVPDEPLAPSLNIPVPEERYVIVDTSGISIEREPAEDAEAAAVTALSDIVLGLWAAGAAAFFGVNVIRYMMFRRRIRPHMIPVETDRGIIDDNKKYRRLKLYRCSCITTPMLMGIIRPVVLIPDREYGSEELSMVLEHEAEHFRRRDIICKLIFLAVNAMYFFNPLVYIMVRDANDTIEYMCDESICADRDEKYREKYSLMLLNEMRSKRSGMLVTGLSSAGKAQKRRFANIKRIGKKTRPEIQVISVIIVGIFSAVILCSYTLAGDSISINTARTGGAGGPAYVSVPDNINTSLDLAVSEAILVANEGKYIEGECSGEGHIILGVESQEGVGSMVYVLTSYGEYDFEDERLVKISGSSSVPAAITLQLRDDNTYEVLDYREPDGSMSYSDFVRAYMPEESWELIFGDTAVPVLTRLEERYAEAYLKRIGREDITIGLRERSFLLSYL